MNPTRLLAFACITFLGSVSLHAQQEHPYAAVMAEAAAHAKQFHAVAPTLSPMDVSVVTLEDGKPGQIMVDVQEMHRMGIRVVPWTTNDSESMRRIIRTGVDGLITDRPDLLQRVLREERERATGDDRERLAKFDVSAHRGGRRLRPENTLPSFEGGLDQLSSSLETDSGVATDHVSTLWHDQFYNPESCRRADGAEYTMENRVYLSDISSVDAGKTFICDKLRFPLDQSNDLSLSPVSVAFAKKDGMINPYAATNVDQLFRFVDFYVQYYRTGEGRHLPEAKARAENAAHVRFNIETKIMPNLRPLGGMQFPSVVRGEKIPKELFAPNHTVGPEVFADTLAGTIARHHMEDRVEIQSFDFRTLQRVEEKFPNIPTFYLTQDAKLFYTDFLPENMRLKSN
ncbi:glycerophosphodiester phosphodiesterase family protein [Terriglobus saanensis]|uniref:Glycerophosphoryl diester phosphodiesterase n=1 Tax=Terriglobus saanensis (strain ATCC BAA-1853 / DSM 23119 / SP1PR4) TaxID=401053 RepID=E8V263_TERSS|nr:glycerophosphodiester phosphodiesterase family protein [Terriglobus saanensis]ADV84620.1 glycerophosphoryl diester phosphodiesterase [Terriglobus saanensis SP1PR4]